MKPYSQVACVLALLLTSECIAAEVPPPPPKPLRFLQPPLPPPKAVRLFAEKGFVEESPHGALRVTFRDLAITGDPKTATPETSRNLIPASIQEMDGARIRISGFMYPPHAETDLKGFMLVTERYYLWGFGRSVPLDEKIGVRMKTGTTTDYIQGRSFDVVGRLRAAPRFLEGKPVFLYMIEDAEVIEPR